MHMRRIKLLKSILIPTLGISAVGTIAAVSTSCGCSIISGPYYLAGGTTAIDITWNGPSDNWIDSDTWMLVDEHGREAYHGQIEWSVIPFGTTSSVDIHSLNIDNGKLFWSDMKPGDYTFKIIAKVNDNFYYTDPIHAYINDLTEEKYLKLEASSMSSFVLNVDHAQSVPNLEYSFDPATYNWFTCEPDELVQFENEIIYLRGDNQSGWSKSDLDYSCIKIQGNVAVSGNIIGLLDNGATSGEEGDITAIPCDYCFYKLFCWSDGIVDSSKKLLSRATVLTNSCYRSMFDNCINLSFSPNLPATTLAENCYRYMYANCYNLKSLPPKIDAEQMAPSCCKQMFFNCVSLLEVPKNMLVDNILAEYCYNLMFECCTSLTIAPELPATDLTNFCYQGMFKNCTSLTIAPELPAEVLTESCYQNMFNGCTSLTQAPELPATTLAYGCYQTMFSGCTSLTNTIGTLPATTLAERCYRNMFNGCTSLTTAPELPATTLATECYTNMFKGCTSLNSIKIGYTGYYDSAYFNGWVTGVSASGAFYYNGDQTAQDFKLPNGWTTEQF